MKISDAGRFFDFDECAFFMREVRRRIRKLEHDADHHLIAKRHGDARAGLNHSDKRFGQLVRESCAQRNGKRNFALCRHGPANSLAGGRDSSNFAALSELVTESKSKISFCLRPSEASVPEHPSPSADPSIHRPSRRDCATNTQGDRWP